MRRRCVAAVPDASTRAFTLQRQPNAYRSRPQRTPPDVVWVYRTNPTQWTQYVHGQPDAYRSQTVRASGKIASVKLRVPWFQIGTSGNSNFNYFATTFRDLWLNFKKKSGIAHLA